MEKITFPTLPDAEGFFFETEEDHGSNVVTKVYENGSKIKKVPLSNGDIATVRELKGSDTINIKRLIDKDTEMYIPAVIALATQINGVSLPMEDIVNIKMRDYNVLVFINNDLNF